MMRPRVYQPNNNPQRSRSPGPGTTRIVINNTREIALNLMDYIEAKLNNKLDSLQSLISKNIRSFKQAEKSFELAESQVFLLGGEKNGRGGITQDIRAFFNIIKAQQTESEVGQSEQDGFSRKPPNEISRKSVNITPRSKTPTRATKLPIRKPEVPRRSVTPTKAVAKSPAPEHRRQQPTPPATRTPLSKLPRDDEKHPQRAPREKSPAQGKENSCRISKDLLEAVQALRQSSENAAPKKRWEQLYELASREKNSTCPSIASSQVDSEPLVNRNRDPIGQKLSEVHEEEEDETPRNRGFPHMMKKEKNQTFNSHESHTLEDFDLSRYRSHR